jgi:hypothetical protein
MSSGFITGVPGLDEQNEKFNSANKSTQKVRVFFMISGLNMELVSKL